MDNKPIRVAQIIGEAHEGGVEAFIMNYYRSIDRSKVQFDFFVESTSKLIDKELIESLGGKVIIIPPLRQIFKYQKTLKKLFKENKYDIVHAHKTTLNIFSLRPAKKAGIKVRISHAHSTTSPKEIIRNTIKNILRIFSKCYATDYFACSETAGRWLFGNKVYQLKRIKVIPNAIDYSRFEFNMKYRIQVRKELNIKKEKLIGNVGRLVTQKNQSFAIKILATLMAKDKNYKLLIVGSGHLKNRLINEASNYGILDNVIFMESCADVEKFYSAMDVFVLPSLYEGLGIVALEAQVNGLPCILSKNVPKEVVISDNVSFVDYSEEEWSSNLMVSTRKKTSFLLKKYDININSTLLCDLYINLSKNNLNKY